MSEQPPPGWVPPAPPAPPPPGHPGYGPPPSGLPWGAPVHKPGVVALRPLSLGDVFEGAFKTIRRNPTAMVGLAAAVSAAFLVVPALLTLALAAAGELSVDLSLDSLADPESGGELPGTFDASALSLVSNLGTLFSFLATILLNGMLVHVVAEAVLGRSSSISRTWAASRGRIWRLLLLAVLDLLLVLLLVGLPIGLGVLVGVTSGTGAGLWAGVPLVTGGVLAAVYLHVRFFQLAAPALMLERMGVRASLRRAGGLSRGQFWRLFGIFVLAAIVVGVVSQVVAVPLGIAGVVAAGVFPGTAGGLALVFSSYLSQILVGAIAAPFTCAVVALQYVDQRIRKEGLDVQLIAAAQQMPTDLR